MKKILLAATILAALTTTAYAGKKKPPPPPPEPVLGTPVYVSDLTGEFVGYPDGKNHVLVETTDGQIVRVYVGTGLNVYFIGSNCAGTALASRNGYNISMDSTPWAHVADGRLYYEVQPLTGVLGAASWWHTGKQSCEAGPTGTSGFELIEDRVLPPLPWVIEVW